MRFDRSQEHEAHDPEASPPEAHPPADPHALLALQRSAGNAAVGRMLSRFYTREGDGKLLWRDNITYDATQWERTGWTTWNLIPYGVYERTLPELVADEVLEAPKKTGKGRRGRRRKKPAAADAPATELVEQEAPEEEDETPAEVAEQGEAPPAVLEDDGGGWEEVRSAGAVRAEREMARDVDGLAGVIDAHEGDPGAISETFSQFFNARVRQGRETTGTIVSSYTTRYDRGRGGYSIEVEIPDLAAWVIHAHLDADGALAPGANAVHYKRLSEVFALGVSITLTPRQVGILLPDQATRLGWTTTNRRGDV